MPKIMLKIRHPETRRQRTIRNEEGDKLIFPSFKQAQMYGHSHPWWINNPDPKMIARRLD